MMDLRRIPAAWWALIVLSVVLHFAGLGDRTFHHDEGIHGHFSYQLAFNGEYRYDPVYHGPFLYFLASRIFLIFGDSDFTARMTTALFGVGMLWIAWRIRRPFGACAAWWAGLLVTISPLFLFYGRFFRSDLIELFTASAALLSLYAATRKPSVLKTWSMFGIWAGLAFATKENAFITAFLLFATYVFVSFTYGFRSRISRMFAFNMDHGRGLVIASSWFIVTVLILYTSFLEYPEDWKFPVKAIRYWTEQHAIERVGGPWWFHLFRLIQYEFLILIGAFIWIFRRKNTRPIESGLFIFGILSIVMYAYLGEKVPWLGIHQIWAFIPLAAAQLARTFGPKGKWWSRSIAATGIGMTAMASLTTNFILQEITPAQQRVESIHYTQASPEIRRVADEIIKLGQQGMKPAAMISNEVAWPLVWYLRRTEVYWGLSNEIPAPPIVVVEQDKQAEICTLIKCGDESFDISTIPSRTWWLPDLDKLTLVSALRYFFTRVPWVDVASYDVLIIKPEHRGNSRGH